MCAIAVVTDSTANMPDDLVKKHNIYVAPLNITWDKVRYRDGIDIKPDEFYKRLRKSKTLPTTSGAIQGEFLQIYESLQGKVDGIVTIVLSSELSAAYSAATNAKELVSKTPIEIIDSRTCTMGMGFGVIAAAKVAAVGGNLEEVVKAAKNTLAKVYFFFALDTLEYLRRGGRVNMPAAMIASFLKVKPILTFENGKVEPAGRPRTRPKAIETLVNLMKERVSSTPLHVTVMHADDLEGLEQLKQEITSRFKYVEMVVTGFTPVMGTHAGPGCIGVAFYNE